MKKHFFLFFAFAPLVLLGAENQNNRTQNITHKGISPRDFDAQSAQKDTYAKAARLLKKHSTRRPCQKSSFTLNSAIPTKRKRSIVDCKEYQ